MLSQRSEISTAAAAASTAVLLLVNLCWTPALHAQQYLGTLTGNVADASGAKVAKAEVTATDVTTHFVTNTVTNNDGQYSIPFLTPDTYSVSVTASGFGTQTVTGIVLTAGANVETDFSLKVASVGANVVVSAQTVQLDTGSANLGTTLSAQETTETPNIGRNPFVLSTLAAGVTTGAYMQSKASGFTNPFSGTAVQIIANGSSGHNRLTLDGIPDDPAERLSGASYTGFVPSPEAVQEVKTQTALYDAQYGHGNGTVLNTVLRSGSNQFHGAAYYLFQNTYMNANTYERVPNQSGALNAASATHRVNDQWSQPGFVIDGPVIIPKLYDGRDKTFFMVAYERIQSRTLVAYTTSTLVPTDAEKAGNFSALCSNFVNGVCAPGAGIQIYDPLTLGANNNRTPFPGNIIPANRISAVGAALMSYYPEPNSTTTGPAVNYVSTDLSYPQKYFSVVTRVDHSFSEKNKMNATFFKAILNQLQTNDGFPKPVGITGSDYTVFRNNEGGTLDDVMVLSPTLVVDARLGLIYHPFGLTYVGNTFNLSSIGINGTGMPYQSFPGTAFTDNYGGLAAGAGGQISETTLGDAAVLISKTIGRHSLRTGFEWNIIRYNVQNPQSGLGTFYFNRQFTQENSSGLSGAACAAPSCVVGSDPNSGDPMAAMLLGYPAPAGVGGSTDGTYGIQVAFALQQLYYAGYLQDDWRVTDRLTLNLGFRWDYESPFTERYNRQNAAFCTTCTNPLQSSVSGLTLNGGLTFVGPSNRFPFPQNFNNYQPRVGAAFQLSPNTVLRGGFGIIYFNTLESPLGQGFSASTNYVATLDNSHPANTLTNPFPSGVALPTGSSLGLSTQVGQSITFPDPNHVQPKMMQYSAGTQTQMPGNVLLQIVYVGNKVTNLEINKNINGLPAQYFNQGAAEATYLQQLVPNPMANLLPGSSLNGATIQRQYLLVPFPEFGSVTDDYASKGSVLYNSLQISATKPLGHGFDMQGNFTWSKIMDRNIYLNPNEDSLDSPFRYQDPNPNLVANLFGAYHFTTLSGRPAWERSILGGWSIHGVLRAQNGSLIATPGSSSGSAGNVTLIGNPRQGHPTYARFFNTCYLNASGTPVATSNTTGPACDSLSPTPAFQQHASFVLNNIGPYLNLRQLVHPLLDTSVFKTFALHERLNLEIRGEFFNVLNTPNFGGPGTNPATTSFGLVTLTQQNDPRIGELTARINF